MKRRMTMLLAILTLIALTACSAGGNDSGQQTKGETQKQTEAKTQAVTEAQKEQTEAQTATQGEKQTDDKWDKYEKVDITPNEKYTFVYANWSAANSFSVQVQEGFIAACDYYGVELVCLDNLVDPIQANANCDTAITMGADFYFQYNQDEEINNAIGEKLKDAGIAGIAIQVPMAAKDYQFPSYCIDNYNTGLLAGGMLADAAIAKWGADENYILFAMGYPESGAMFQQRAQGAIEGVQQKLKNIELFENSTEGDTEVARQRMTDFLTAHPEGKILVWTNADHVALGELAAIEAAGREDDVLLVSNALDISALTTLRDPDSVFIGTIDFNAYNWGWELVPKAIEWLNTGEECEKEMSPSSVALTKEAVSEYYPE